MKTYLYYLTLFLFNSVLIQAQDSTTLFKGQLIDKKTNAGLEYVNIGIEGTPVGCISKEDGHFELEYFIEEFRDSSITISAIGYEKMELRISSLQFDSIHQIILYPVIYELQSATVTSKEPKIKNFGISKGGDGLIKGMLHGLEKAFLIPVKGKEIKLLNLRFGMRTELDTVIFRVNFYENQSNTPGARINNESLIYTLVSDEDGWVDCDLSSKNLTFSSDFYVAVELLPAIRGNLEIKSHFKAKIGGKSKLFTRDYLDSWEQIKGLGVILNIDYYQIGK